MDDGDGSSQAPQRMGVRALHTRAQMMRTDALAAVSQRRPSSRPGDQSNRQHGTAPRQRVPAQRWLAWAGHGRGQAAGEAGETADAPRASSMPPKPVRQVKVPVERPPVKHVSVSQSWFAEPPTKEPLPTVDLREAGEKSASRNIAHDLKDLAFQLSCFQTADKLVERLSADEREEVRLGIEAVMRIKAALDRLGQRNAQLHKERQRAP
jgi:hypothetical protein